ncbi:MAG: alpha-L-fucosidase [Bacteroidales bacterium]
MRALRSYFLLISISFFAFNGFSQQNVDTEITYQWPSDPAVSEKLHQWQDWKFGVIIHWGPYSEWGVVESWSLCPEDEPWCKRTGPFSDNYYTYVNAYEKLRETFDPTGFDPEHWAEACRKAGMKYVVFTTKHHDGFCMFDSKYTDYKITDQNSKFSMNPKSNIAKEVFNAFRAKGFATGVYFSKPDWHNNDYWWQYFPVFDRNVNYDPQKYPDKWENYKKFTFNQLEELMTDYGTVDILWLDGGWVRPANSFTEETRPWLGKNQWIQDINMQKIASMARLHQPGLLIVDRTVHGEFENYRTPEQQIPVTIPAYPWESCITLGDNWYSTSPSEHYKSVNWAIHTLIKIIAKGGNFLLGIGPDKTGNFVPEVYKRLEQIGKWMDINSQAIYETRPLPPYDQGKIYFSQSKDGEYAYAFYLIDENDPLPVSVELPDIFAGSHKTVKLLGHDKNLPLQRKSGITKVMIPKSFVKTYSDTPALVFRIRNQK